MLHSGEVFCEVKEKKILNKILKVSSLPAMHHNSLLICKSNRSEN